MAIGAVQDKVAVRSKTIKKSVRLLLGIIETIRKTVLRVFSIIDLPGC